MSDTFDGAAVRTAIAAFGQGEMLIVTDDGGRENEGDLVLAASHCTPAKMAFIVRHTSGIVCTPMTAELARRFDLAPMVARNDAPHATAFTVSIDYRHGTTTGISAEDRTLTVRNLANANAGSDDFVRPGHIFPLVAREGGVLMRSGHTEAAVDLCRLADLPPVGVICELVNDDGTVMRGDRLRAFARDHGLRTVTIADLIAHRQRTETLVARVREVPFNLRSGRAARAFIYALPWDPMHHVAIVLGDIDAAAVVPVRLHVENVIDDVFGADERLQRIAAEMEAEGCGVIVYLREGSVGVGRSATSRPHPEADEAHAEAQQRRQEWREIGLGAQILRDLNIGTIRLLASRERHYVGLEGFGLTIAATQVI